LAANRVDERGSSALSLIEQAGLPDQLFTILLKQGLYFLQDSAGGSSRYIDPTFEEPAGFFDPDSLSERVSNKLLKDAKELVVIGTLDFVRPDPGRIDQTGKQMPLQQCFHLLLEERAKLTPVAIVLGMDEKSSDEVDVLDIQPTAAAREQIATTVFERQSRLHKTILA